VRKVLYFIGVLVFPFAVLGLSVRLAFTETAVELIQQTLPPERFGMSDEKRLELAKLGLRAVLSEEGMRAFKEAKLAGRRAFREKEVKHMEDVARFLRLFFPAVYALLILWLGLAVYLKSPRFLVLSGITGVGFLAALALLVFANYERAFELFHLWVFDPYSWRFKDEDTLLRVYPMEFWFKATLLVAALSFLISLLTLLIGILWEKRRRPKGVF